MRALPRRTITALGVALLLASCSGSGNPNPTPTPSPAFVVLGKVHPAVQGRPFPTVPRHFPRGGYVGHLVFITDGAFVPKNLYAGINRPVVFVNATNRTQVIRFLNWANGGPAGSGPIPPGGTWTYHSPYTGTYLYVSDNPPPKVQGYMEWDQVQK